MRYDFSNNTHFVVSATELSVSKYKPDLDSIAKRQTINNTPYEMSQNNGVDLVSSKGRMKTMDNVMK